VLGGTTPTPKPDALDLQLADTDGDTKVQVEESADEDKIRMDTGGTERAVLDSTALDLTVPLKVDTVSEHTGAAGVTIDGVTCKDNAVEVDAIRGLKESGGQALDMGAVADGEYLKRSGTDVVGDTPAGGGTKIEDADTDTKVDVEEGADEDKVRMDVAGTERFLLQDASPYLTITGNAKFSDAISVKGATANSNYWIEASAASPSLGASTYILRANPSGAVFAGNGTFVAVYGAPSVGVPNGATGNLQGLEYNVGGWANNVTAASTYIRGLNVAAGALAGGASGDYTITDMAAIYYPRPSVQELTGSTVAVTNYTMIDVADVNRAGVITNLIGMKIADCTNATNNYILELGPTPYLRLLGSGTWAAAANETPLYIAEGAVPTSRQLKTVLESDLDTAAGTKLICYLV